MASTLAGMTLGQRIGGLFGVVYVLIGGVGFAVTSGIAFAGLRGKDLIIFEVNPLHNVVHLGIGAALVYAALNSPAASSLMNRLIGGTYLVVALLGVFLVEADTSLFRGLSETRSELNILALNHPDNLLHIASAIVLLGSTLIGQRQGADSLADVPETRDASKTRGDTPETVPEERQPSRPAGSSRRRFVAGDAAPRSGSYRCACGQFAVAIRQGREFPDCPEPSGTDEDHYSTLRPRSTSPSAKAERRPSTTANVGSRTKPKASLR